MSERDSLELGVHAELLCDRTNVRAHSADGDDLAASDVLRGKAGDHEPEDLVLSFAQEGEGLEQPALERLARPCFFDELFAGIGRAGAYWLMAGLAVLGAVLTQMLVPETGRIALEGITERT